MNIGYYGAFAGRGRKHFVSLAYLIKSKITTGRFVKATPIPLKYLISHTDPIVSSPVCYSSARATFHTHISITMQTQVKLQPQVSNKITIHIFIAYPAHRF